MSIDEHSDGAGQEPAAHPAGDASAHGAGGHGAEDEELGPVDYGAWAAGLAGLALGLITAACFALATAPIGR